MRCTNSDTPSGKCIFNFLSLLYIYYYCQKQFQDLHGVNLEEFKYGGTNITAFRLVDPDGPDVKRIFDIGTIVKVILLAR